MRLRRRHRLDGFTLAFTLAGSLLLVFILAPLVSTFIGTPRDALWQTLTDADVQASLVLTFVSALGATVIALLTGVPLAYLLARKKFPGKQWIQGIVNLPVVVPHTAAGIALLMVFGRNAPVGQVFANLGVRFTNEMPGIVVGMLFVSLPYLVNAAREAFALIDPELELVAQVDGASRWQAFSRVTLPLAARGIAAGAVMMWGRGISEFGAVIILAYNPKIIPVLVYEFFAGFGLSAALPLTVILIFASLVVFVLLQMLLTPKEEQARLEK